MAEKPRKYFSAAAFVAPDDFPLDLVASIAAKFLTGDNYAEAVERAIRLLQECKDTITENKAKKEFYTQEARRMGDLKQEIDAPPGAFKIPLRLAISQITGQKRAGRAEVQYLTFLGHTPLGRTPEERTKTWKLQEADGIDALEVEVMTKKFAGLKAEGKISDETPPKKVQKNPLSTKRDSEGANHRTKLAKPPSSLAKKAKPSAKRSKRADNR